MNEPASDEEGMRLAYEQAKKLLTLVASAKSERQRRPLLAEAFRMLAISQNAAKDAAPYVHSKLPTLQSDPTEEGSVGSVNTAITVTFVGGTDPKMIEGFDQPRKMPALANRGFDRNRLSVSEGN